MTERGFSDVAVESAHTFRAIMQAMARPGRIQVLEAGVSAPAPLLASAAAVALTLCDFQTAIWLSPDLRTESVARFLRFHSGAPIVDDAGKAQFVFATAGGGLPDPTLLLQGTHEYPDRSATLVIQIGGFGGEAVELTGPGLRGDLVFGAMGLGHGFWAAMAENHARFPTGIDVIFAAPGAVAALPRSTAIHLLEPV